MVSSVKTMFEKREMRLNAKLMNITASHVSLCSLQKISSREEFCFCILVYFNLIENGNLCWAFDHVSQWCNIVNFFTNYYEILFWIALNSSWKLGLLLSHSGIWYILYFSDFLYLFCQKKECKIWWWINFDRDSFVP